MRLGPMSGCYVDGCTKVPKGIAAEKQKTYGPAKAAMLTDLQSKVNSPLQGSIPLPAATLNTSGICQCSH